MISAVILAATIVVVSILIGGSYTVLTATFAVGTIIGVIGRDIGYSWRIVSRWQLTVSVLNWEKIEQLLQEDAASYSG